MLVNILRLDYGISVLKCAGEGSWKPAFQTFWSLIEPHPFDPVVRSDRGAWNSIISLPGAQISFRYGDKSSKRFAAESRAQSKMFNYFWVVNEMNDLIRNKIKETFGVNSPGNLAFLCKANVKFCNAGAHNTSLLIWLGHTWFCCWVKEYFSYLSCEMFGVNSYIVNVKFCNAGVDNRGSLMCGGLTWCWYWGKDKFPRIVIFWSAVYASE